MKPLLVFNAQAYGPVGHRLVGDIADRLLVGRPVEKKLDKLLDGLRLGDAATLPDEIKGWDKEPPASPHAFHLGIELIGVKSVGALGGGRSDEAGTGTIEAGSRQNRSYRSSHVFRQARTKKLEAGC